MISKRDMNPFFQKGGFIMSNKKSKLGVISAVAAGTGTAIYLAQKAKKESGNSESGNSIFKKSTVADSSVPDNYRNTERGKYDRNSKGIYYSNGNYEAFAHPEKPEGVDQKNAYIVGSGLASLAAACFLVRDAQMPGCQIHILEAMDIAGGACDGIYDTSRGYVMRGGREMENHFECLWDLFRSIPSIETPGVSVLDEYYWLNKHDPNYSLCRATVNRGKDAHTDGKFNLSLYPNSFGNELHNNMKKLVFSSIKILYKIDDTIFNPPESFTPGDLSETIMIASASYAFP